MVDPRNPKWPLARIVETFPGPDGHVHTVRIMTGGKLYLRPITKLCPLVSADRELRDMVRNFDQDQIVEEAAAKGIEWRFNPPWDSHHGGLFKTLVKSTKRALKAILGEARVTEEEFHTALVEVEGILNSRPLTYCSDDPKDESVLTPNHFLVGQAGVAIGSAGSQGHCLYPKAQMALHTKTGCQCLEKVEQGVSSPVTDERKMVRGKGRSADRRRRPNGGPQESEVASCQDR
jgi:hypothetical protein